MKPRRTLIAVIAMLVLGPSLPLLAEPAFAVRTGYRCSQCHVNRTGGGLRTAFGSIYTQTVLPSRLLTWREGGNMLPADPDARFAFGADVRVQYLYVASDEPDTDDISSFEVPGANIYLEGRLLPGRLSLYLDETVGPGGASTRELFGLYSFGKWNGYLKAGKFLPAFGWRLPDDDAFIRQFSGFTYSAPDTGIEFGVEPGKWSAHVSVVNGASGGGDDNRSKKISAMAVRRFRYGRVGLSGANNISGGATIRQAGLLGGLNFGRLALLAEVNGRELEQEGDSSEGVAALLEADILLLRGLNLKLAHDWVDPDRDVATDALTRDSVGIEYIPYPFVQLRLFYRHRDGPPQTAGSRGNQLELEAHFFF